jgi:beta-galactosidase
MSWLWWVACAGNVEEPAPAAPRDFPEGFHFGAATAGFQVDMGCDDRPDCLDVNSDWYQWVTSPQIVGDASLYVNGDPLGDGPGMWGERFEADVALMAASGFTAYRMSLEWSRLFPDGAAEAATTVDELVAMAEPGAVARYHEMFAALRAAGIEPVVTVNHYTLPLWVHDGVACHDDPDGCGADGWVNGERMVPLIASYSGFVAREFGGEVDQWFTLNEPYATGLSGYLLPGEARSAPPGLSFDFDRTVLVMQHQIIGHAAMVDQIRAEDTVDANGDGVSQTIGIVLNMAVFEPADPAEPKDVAGAAHADYLYHQLFYDALVTGRWDSDLDGVPDEDRPDLGGRLDVIGINYYNRVSVKGAGVSLSPALPLLDFVPEFSWDPYPEGLGRVVTRAAAWDLPIWVTENGTPYVDERGVEVLDGHLASLRDAMDDGADVRSYLYWSFVDNYEWNHGYTLAFGLYRYDPATLEREERPVGARLAAVASSGRL